jgi:hypothetical protein
MVPGSRIPVILTGLYCIAWAIVFLCPAAVFSQGTTVNYQGLLDSNGALVSGDYDFLFLLVALGTACHTISCG